MTEKNYREIHETFDIRSFNKLTSIKLKLESMIKDIEKLSDKAMQLDNKQYVYETTIAIRKAMQKIKQKAHSVRETCLVIKKIEKEGVKEKKIVWCPDPDYAFTCECKNLGVEDCCQDNKDCILCSKD